MKNIIPLLIIAVLLFACNNDKNQSGPDHHKKDIPKTQQDSLMAEVMDGHNVGMGKMGKIRGAQKEAQRLLDSIAILPAKVQITAAELKSKLQSLINDLNYADFAMDKWMTEFNMDSAKNSMEQRLQYLSDEKLKVGKVKEAILKSLQKADSLLKAKL